MSRFDYLRSALKPGRELRIIGDIYLVVDQDDRVFASVNFPADYPRKRREDARQWWKRIVGD